MKVGADRKKIGILAGLLLVALFVFYTNVISPGDDRPAPSPRTPASRAAQIPDVPPAPVQAPAAEPRVRTVSRTGAGGQEYRPKFKMNKPGEGPDPVKADPTLRLDLLSKVQSVNIEGGERNLFQFGAAPPPKVVAPKIVPKPAAEAKTVAEGKPPEPVKPPPPPIPLKFYGYTSQARSEKKAFFLDGEDIVVVREGDLVKKRYKVVRIGINSVVVEDTELKSEQTLPLEEQAG